MKASCQSLASGLLNVVGTFLDDFQEFRKNAAKVVVDTIIPGKSSTALNNLIDDAIDLQTKMYKSYGVVVGEGKGKIGPRHLIIPTKKVTGNVLTERTFVVAPSLFDKVTVTVKKTGGKAGVDIAACAKYSTGAHFDEKRKSIEKGKDSDGDSVTFTFTDMAEKLLTIHLVQPGLVSNTCEYYVSIEGEFDEDEMKKLDTVSHGSGAVRA